MKNILSVMFLFALLASSCSEDELVKNQPSLSNTLKFTASFEDNESRTYVEEGNLLRWTAGDQISLFVANTLNQQYQFEGETGDNSGYFKKIDNSFGTGNDLNCHYAVYPYSSDMKITDHGFISATLPAKQSYAENSFGLGTNTMVAVTEDTDDTYLKFKNVGGYLKLQLYGDDVTVKTIVLQGNAHEKIAGKATITSVYGGEPVVSMAADATETIALDCGEDGVKIGTTAETATAFWIVVPPVSFEKGFETTVTDMNGGTFTQSTSNEIAVERNVIKPMAAFEVKIEAIPNSRILYTYTGEDGVKLNNDQAFLDADGDMLTYTNEYADGKGIISFDGILATLETSAFNDKNLTSITLPDGITEIKRAAFSYCSKLETVALPNSLTKIGMGAFYQCPGITKFDGKFASEDGKCLIVDGVLNAFACGCGVTEYTIPDGVTTIGDWAFYYGKSLTKITIPNSVTAIGDDAFYRCENLTNIIIGDGVTTIGDWAFSSCESLVNITIPNSVTTIGDYAFQSCSNLTNATIGNGVTTIGNYAFYNCGSLVKITIPNNVTTIGKKAFFGCSSLKEFEGKYATEDGYSLVVDGTLNSFAAACGATEYIIPNSVTTIGEDAFYNCTSLTSVKIPNSVTTIGETAFYGCDNLKEVYCEATTPPYSGSGTFGYGWNGKIYVYKECVEAYKSAWSSYSKCITENGNYPYNATTIIYYTTSDEQTITCNKIPVKSNTYSNGQGKMVIYGGLKVIPESAFSWNSQLTSITIPSSVTGIGKSAFSSCGNLSSVTVGENVTNIGQDAFSNCSKLTSVKIPDSVLSIGENAFQGCANLSSATIGENVTTIGNNAFSNCRNLTSVKIPDSVMSIGDLAFQVCTSLSSVTIGENVTTVGNNVFIMCPNIQEFKGKFAAQDGRSLIIDNTIAYYANASGTEYTIPDGVTAIRHNAFTASTNLTSITIPNSVTEVEPYAFVACSNLKEFKGKFAADGGRCLIKKNAIIAYAEGSGTSYHIPDNVTAIRDYAFASSVNLTSVTIPNSVNSIGYAAFTNCTKLSSVTMGENVTNIGNSAFYYCNLTSVTIPGSVKSIGSNAFYCPSLKTVDVKATTPPVIDSYTFYKSNVEFYVPAQSLDAYLAANYWKDLNFIVK